MKIPWLLQTAVFQVHHLLQTYLSFAGQLQKLLLVAERRYQRAINRQKMTAARIAHLPAMNVYMFIIRVLICSCVHYLFPFISLSVCISLHCNSWQMLLQTESEDFLLLGYFSLKMLRASSSSMFNFGYITNVHVLQIVSEIGLYFLLKSAHNYEDSVSW